MLWILGVFLVIVAAMSIIFSGAFWWTNLRTGHRAVIRERFGAVTWPVIRAFSTNGLSMAFAFALLPLGMTPWLRRPAIDPGCARPPVIFVHGLVHNASAWILHRRWFKASGYSTQYFFAYNSLTRTPPEIIHEAAEFIQGVLDAHPGQKVVLVGHSLGGLCLRAALTDTGLAERTAALATLGAPHQGSVLANIGLNRLSRSLAFQGPLIKRIEELETANPGPPLPRLSIYTLLDGIIVPNEGTRIRMPGWQEAEAGMVGHVDLLFYKPGADMALAFLDDVLNGPD